MYDKKTLQYCKVISLQLIKINEKKKRVMDSEWPGICFRIIWGGNEWVGEENDEARLVVY